ncbi:MAG: HlyC/CorC family transporter [Chloroflexi bacterium]|nr:HlyC/CorC family transporter [Chloroflexota bacterium]
MDVPLGLTIGILVLALALMFFVALAEAALAGVNRSQLRRIQEEGASSAARVEALLQNGEGLLAGAWVLRIIAVTATTAMIMNLVSFMRGNGLALVTAWMAGVLVLLVLHMAGRSVGLRRPLSVALRVVWPLRVLLGMVAFISRPLVWLAHAAGAMGAQPERSVFLTEDGLRLLLNFGAEEPLIEAEERKMIDSIFRFGETTVEEVMVPRVDVVALDVNVSLQEALDTIVEVGHSRIPVYEGNIDRIVGILYAKDLLACYREGKRDVVIREVMRKPYFVPESAMVDDLLRDLQSKRTHLAIVVDEYGGTAGIVTIEDLLEEIVGEIQDEYDSEAPLIQRLGPGKYLVNGRADIDDLNREIGATLPEEDESYTLAGVIYAHLQRVPDKDDEMDLGNVHLKVVDVTDNRIEQVEITLRRSDDGQLAALKSSGGRA